MNFPADRVVRMEEKQTECRVDKSGRPVVVVHGLYPPDTGRNQRLVSFARSGRVVRNLLPDGRVGDYALDQFSVLGALEVDHNGRCYES